MRTDGPLSPFARIIIIILLFPVVPTWNLLPVMYDAYLTLALLFYVSFANQHKLFIEKKRAATNFFAANATADITYNQELYSGYR